MKHIFGLIMEENSAPVNGQNCTNTSYMVNDLSRSNLECTSSTRREEISIGVEPNDILEINIASKEHEGQITGISQDQIPREVMQDKSVNIIGSATTMPLDNLQPPSNCGNQTARTKLKGKSRRRCMKVKRLELPVNWKNDQIDSCVNSINGTRLTRNALRKSMDGKRKASNRKLINK